MTAKFPTLNWISSVLATTVTLVTLSCVVPEVAQGESTTSNFTSSIDLAQTDRNVPQSIYNTGQSALEQQNFEQAITYFNQAIAINSQYAQAYQGRALARDSMGDYEGAASDLRIAASLYWRQGNASAAYQAIRLIDQMGKKFVCRQRGDRWETVMKLDSKLYPLIVWHDQRVLDIDDNGNPVFLEQDPMGVALIPDFNRTVVEIQNDQGAVVTMTVAEKNTQLSAQGRCTSVSERLDSIGDALINRGAQEFFRLETLEKIVEETTETGEVLTFKNNIQVACIPDAEGVCDERNAIFTLTGKAEGEGVQESNQERLERLIRLIDHPGSGDPIHN
ncbi:tetratricopeptide repeat protein [Roseofilum capinflatum]|uniref:Tetratricopeptide repeat protein n=1 Tax=Roseofilum capinflatum BLCC-M114 TaxID=3022440 RepID=A0ABT7B1E4_9CYAN|nr:tetratricopeptide repeat protein [Roseofilum capinflatum]MDJ1172982.1 tetratricopeptide repeat protein [Roseofilum capinflatum BLCC-M114]